MPIELIYSFSSSALPKTSNHDRTGGFLQGRAQGTIPCKHRRGGTEGFCIMTLQREMCSTSLAPFKFDKPHSIDHR